MNKEDLVFPDAFNSGLTKRELFAAMAMQGFISNTNAKGSLEDFASDSVKLADALLKKLDK